MALTEVSATDRFTTPYAQSGIIFVTWKDGTSAQGSCAVVGRNDILTAGHVIYNPDRGGWADKFSIYFGADYNNQTDRFDSRNWVYSLESGSFRWTASAWPESLFTDASNSTNLDSEAQYDLALIGVSIPIGDVTGWLVIDPNRDYSQLARQIGYPNSGTGMMTDTASVTRSRFWGVYDSNSANMGPGSSGGPLVTTDNYVIGVKSGRSESRATWADIGFLWDQLYPKLSDNDSLVGGAVDDYEASAATKGTLSVGGSTYGKIESVGDVDWFKVNLIAGETYRFTLKKYPITGAIGDPFLRLYNSAGVLLSSEDGSGDLPNAELTFTASTTGTYYIAALQSTSSLAASPATGAYKLSLAELTAVIPTIQFSTTSSSANEGNAGSTTVTVQATLSATSNKTVTVPITYSGTATQGTDYTNAIASISIPAGQTTGTATFSVVGDTAVEPNETIILTMGTPTNATLGTDKVYTHTVLNDDQQVMSRTNALTVLGVLGSTPVLLKDLVEEITMTGTTVTSHTVSHQGTKFKYSDIDALITTVIRDGEFTEEFRKEIADAYPSYGGITYKEAISLAGAANIDSSLISVAGADGNYVG